MPSATSHDGDGCRNRAAVVVLSVAALLAARLASADAPAPLPAPNLDIWNTGSVATMLRLADGSLIVGGGFESVYDPATQLSVDRRGLAKYTAGGALDLQWNAEIECLGLGQQCVEDIAIDANGGLLVAGFFPSVQGQPRAGLARVSLANGQLDTAWTTNTGNTGFVSALEIDGTGRIYLAGSFAEINGVPRAGLARVSGAGVLDPDWQVSTDEFVSKLAADADGTLYLAGNFAAVSGVARNGLARVGPSGALDFDWNPDVSFNGSVLSLRLAGGALYVGGRFAEIGGQPRANIAKLAITGTGEADPDWAPDAVPDALVTALDVANGKLFAGYWSPGDDFRVAGVAKLDAGGTGATDGTWTPPLLECSRGGSVCFQSVLAAPDGSVVAGGDFDRVNGQLGGGLAFLSSAGVRIARPFPQSRGVIERIVVAPDGSAYASGAFARVDDLSRGNLLKLAPDGTLDRDWNPTPNGTVYDLAVDASGNVVVAGNFTRIGGIAATFLARLASTGSGAADPSWLPEPNDAFNRLATGVDGSVYVGGSFTAIGGASRARLARIEANGTVDEDWNPAPDGTIDAVATDPGNGAVYVAGDFTTIGGQSIDKLAKLAPDGSGAADATWNPAPNVIVRGIVADGAGAVYVYGFFDFIGGQSRYRLARLSATGAGEATPAWDAPLGTQEFLDSMTLDSRGALIVAGGALRNIGGVSRRNIARLLPGDGTVDPAWDPNPNCLVFATAATPTASVLAGGCFTTIGDAPRRLLAAVPVVVDALFANGFE